MDERNRRITLRDLPPNSLEMEKPLTDAPGVPIPQPDVDERDTRVTLQGLPSGSPEAEKPVTDAPDAPAPQPDEGQTASQAGTTT